MLRNKNEDYSKKNHIGWICFELVMIFASVSGLRGVTSGGFGLRTATGRWGVTSGCSKRSPVAVRNDRHWC